MSSEQNRDVRPKRRIRPPGWLGEYDVTVPGLRPSTLLTSSTPAVQPRVIEEQPSFSHMEGYAG